MSIRGDLRIGETLRGTLREKSHSYTVVGRILLKRHRGGRRCARCEQWRLIDENRKEIWLEIDHDAGTVILHEPVPIRPGIDPLSLQVGQTWRLRVRGRPCTVVVEDVYCAEIDNETGMIMHPVGAVATTTCAELQVMETNGPLSRMVIDAHRLQDRKAYSRTVLSSSEQSKILGRPVYRPWWVPRFVRGFGRWLSAAIFGAVGSWFFWLVLLLIVMVFLEWIDDDGLIPSGGGSFFRNRSVYGGGGGGVGK
ncbi:hypothetical protein [Actinomyces sp. ZJ308]|uniref:hypothetical protein n=1 Tax=Actinomyces sp. ZJ308 TaxID=2708342 RepID=UPI00141DEE07|nr:hypothetical protein [Actinomyces sp. ZJ308]